MPCKVTIQITTFKIDLYCYESLIGVEIFTINEGGHSQLTVDSTFDMDTVRLPLDGFHAPYGTLQYAILNYQTVMSYHIQ